MTEWYLDSQGYIFGWTFVNIVDGHLKQTFHRFMTCDAAPSGWVKFCLIKRPLTVQASCR